MERVKIGWAKREVSINENVPLMGQFHVRPSQGIQDPLYVTALAVDGGEGQDAVIFLACDVVVLRGGIIDHVKEKVAAMDPSIPVENIVMNATHTHTGGPLNAAAKKAVDGTPLFPWEEYHEFYAKQAAEAACEAWKARKPGGIGYGYSYAVVGHSRRPVYFVDKGAEKPESSNGRCVMYGKTNDPDFSHYEAGADHFVNVMITYDEKNAVTGFVINVPCPSQISEMGVRFSADYWNEVREVVRKEFGEGVFVLPQCAAAGDLSPRILHYKAAQARRMALKYDRPYDGKLSGRPDLDEEHEKNWENKTLSERYDIAERILFAVKDVASWASKDIRTEVKLRHVEETLPLIPRLLTEEEKKHCEEVLEKVKLEIPEDANDAQRSYLTTHYNTVVNRNKNAIARYEKQDPEKRIPMRMHVIRIDDICFATNRFELYQDYQHRMQARSPFLQTFVVQLAGDENGSYLPTERAQANRGYGSSFYENQVGFEGGQQIVEETLRILNEMKAEDTAEG